MCPNYFYQLCHSWFAFLHNSWLWNCLRFGRSDQNPLKDEDNDEDDPEILRFWVPQRSFSSQSVHSLTPSLKSLKRDSITSASTIAEEDITNGWSNSRRNSDISRFRIGKSHEWPERTAKVGTHRLLDRADSTSSIGQSSRKDSIKSQSNVISEGEVSCSPSADESSSPEEEELTFGELFFSTNYDQKKKRLNVHLDKASDLPFRGRKKTYDTMTRIILVNKNYDINNRNSFTSKDIIAIQNSKKVKNSSNPHFHEDFIFDVDKFDALKNLALRLSIFDCERQGRFDAIGHIVLSLTCLTKPGESKKHHLPFKSQSSLEWKPNGPQLLVSLCYSSTTDRLTVGILRCRRLLTRKFSILKNLLRATNASKLETYVKVTLMCASHKIKSIKTNTVWAEPDSDPIFNQTINFVAPHGFIDDISVVMSVCVKGKLKFDRVIGRVISGPIAFASNDKMTHWGKMIFGQPGVITEWRNLYS